MAEKDDGAKTFSGAKNFPFTLLWADKFLTVFRFFLTNSEFDLRFSEPLEPPPPFSYGFFIIKSLSRSLSRIASTITKIAVTPLSSKYRCEPLNFPPP